MDTGSVALRIPRDAMHTFEAPHNKVIWTLKVQGDVKWWPDFEYEFPMLAGPPAVRNWEV
jgi:hypothetical protein